MLKIYESIGNFQCVEIIATITPIRKIEKLEGWLGAHIRNLLLAATSEVVCESGGTLMDEINHFPIEDAAHPWYKELKCGFPKGYTIKVLSPNQSSYRLDIGCDESIEFSVTLIGSLSKYASKMIRAIEIFAERGILSPMELEINAVNQYSMLELLYELRECDLIAIDFVTPLLLAKSKSVTPNSIQSKMNGFVSMYQLVMVAANRLFKMAALYGDFKVSTEDISEAIEELTSIASGITLQSCNLSRVVLSTLKKRATKNAMVFDGLIGETQWRGDIAQLYPLLKFCSYISLGENVVYGMGDFKVQKVDHIPHSF
ncbi:MAG: CRISPR system precrRNA processing endoribonuclease RAMP protein Cas6 [Rikenellaceae bacterium]